MLKGLEEILGKYDLPEEVKSALSADVNGAANGLINKKTELEEKISKLKQGADDNSSAAEKLKALEARLEREQLEGKQNYQDALKLQEQEYKAQLDKLTGSVSEKDQLIHKLLVENGLSAELVALNVNKDLMPMIQAGIAAQAQVVDGQAMIGDKSLSDYCKEWSETPAGKAARLAPNNSGGDASGGGTSTKGKKMAELTGAERTHLFKTDPAEFNRLKAEMNA